MNYKEEREANQAIVAEFKALTVLLSERMMNEAASPEAEEDLNYYMRKLNEMRARIKYLKKVGEV